MTRIGFEGMEFFAFHGYYESERKMGNKYLLDVFVSLSSDLKPTEDISDTVNYEDIYEICKSEMAIPRKLLETVSFSIVERLKKEKKNIAKVDLKLKKVGVQLGGKIEQSVIEYSS